MRSRWNTVLRGSELKAVVTKWATDRKIANERTMHDPIDRDQVPQHESWGGYPASDEKPDASPDVNYTNPKGKGKGDWNTKGGKGFITQTSSPIMLAMLQDAFACNGRYREILSDKRIAEPYKLPPPPEPRAKAHCQCCGAMRLPKDLSHHTGGWSCGQTCADTLAQWAKRRAAKD